MEQVHGSWGLNIKNSKDFVEKREALYNKYRPIELDNTIEKTEKFKLMEKWYKETLDVLLEYKLKEADIYNTVASNKFILRTGTKEFLEKMHNSNVPVLMLSAGVGNVIESILNYNNIYFDNIHLDSNFLIFKNGEAVGVNKKIIHTMNKNSADLIEKFGDVIKNRRNIILFGDIVSDIDMVSAEDLNNTITVGFLDVKKDENLDFYNKSFDIVCTDQTSFLEVMKILNI